MAKKEESILVDEPPVKILYISGAGRSGSTLLGDVLGAIPKTLHVGELRGIFDYTIIPDNLMPCSCGRSYQMCDFWNPNFEALYGAKWQDKFNQMKIEGELPRSLHLPGLALKKKFNQTNKLQALNKIQETINHVVNLLSYIQEHSTSSLIIDTSKAAPFAWLLAQHPDVHLVTVHLIRDPRATLFSWLNRAIPIPDLTTGRATIRTRPLREGFAAWVKDNSGAWILRFLGIPYLRINYESFVSNPIHHLDSVAKFAFINGIPLTLGEDLRLCLREKQAPFSERHLIGSNPRVKRNVNHVAIREDTAWLEGVSTWTKVLWTLMFLPWILLFGFPIWPTKKANTNRS